MVRKIPHLKENYIRRIKISAMSDFIFVYPSRGLIIYVGVNGDVGMSSGSYYTKRKDLISAKSSTDL